MKRILFCFIVIMALTLTYVSWYVPQRDYARLLKVVENAEPGWRNSASLALEIALDKGYSIDKLEEAVWLAVEKEEEMKKKGEVTL